MKPEVITLDTAAVTEALSVSVTTVDVAIRANAAPTAISETLTLEQES